MSLEPNVDLSELLRQGRASKGLKQADAAERIGVAQATWSMWEREERAPADKKLTEISELLELDLAELRDAKKRATTARTLKSAETSIPNIDHQANEGWEAGESQSKSDFVKAALKYAKERAADAKGHLEINIVGPETLPFVKDESIQNDWAANIRDGAQYNLIWFIDSLLFNNLFQEFLDFSSALDSLDSKIKLLGSISSPEDRYFINHYFVWSALLENEFDPDSDDFQSACARASFFIDNLAGEKASQRSLVNNVILVNSGDNCIANEEELRAWISRQIGAKDEKANELRLIGANIAARFWCNRDLLVIFIDSKEIGDPNGYNIPRSGYRSFEEAAQSKGGLSDGVPRALQTDEGKRALALIKKIKNFNPQHHYQPVGQVSLAGIDTNPSKETTA